MGLLAVACMATSDFLLKRWIFSSQSYFDCFSAVSSGVLECFYAELIEKPIVYFYLFISFIWFPFAAAVAGWLVTRKGRNKNWFKSCFFTTLSLFMFGGIDFYTKLASIEGITYFLMVLAITCLGYQSTKAGKPCS